MGNGLSRPGWEFRVRQHGLSSKRKPLFLNYMILNYMNLFNKNNKNYFLFLLPRPRPKLMFQCRKKNCFHPKSPETPQSPPRILTKTRQNSSKILQDHPKICPRPPKIAPKCPKLPPSPPKVASRSSLRLPRSPKTP